MVQAQASQPPPNFGYLPGYWTIALLMRHLDRFGIRVSFSTLRRALHQAEFRWKWPKLALARRPDPVAAEKQTKLAQVLADSEATLSAEDEGDVHLLPSLRAVWQRRGEQHQLTTPGQNQKQGAFGVLNLRSGERTSPDQALCMANCEIVRAAHNAPAKCDKNFGSPT